MGLGRAPRRRAAAGADDVIIYQSETGIDTGRRHFDGRTPCDGQTSSSRGRTPRCDDATD